MTTMMSLFDGAVTEMNYYAVGIRVRRSYIILGVHHTSHSSSQIITFFSLSQILEEVKFSALRTLNSLNTRTVYKIHSSFVAYCQLYSVLCSTSSAPRTAKRTSTYYR